MSEDGRQQLGFERWNRGPASFVTKANEHLRRTEELTGAGPGLPEGVDNESVGGDSPTATFRITGSTGEDQHEYTAIRQAPTKTATGYDGWQDAEGAEEETLYSLWEQANDVDDPIPDGTFVAALRKAVEGGESEWWVIGSAAGDAGEGGDVGVFKVTGNLHLGSNQHAYFADRQEKSGAEYGAWADGDSETLFSLWEEEHNVDGAIPNGSIVVAVKVGSEWWIVGPSTPCRMLQTVDGWNAGETQMLVNEEGTCKWVTVEECESSS